MNFSVFVINLDKDIERLAHIDDVLNGKGLAFTRVPAVFGAQLTDQQKGFYRSGGRNALSAGEVGCMLSHIKAWKMAAASKNEFSLILEDDIHFCSGFNDFISDFNRVVDSGEIVIHKIETMLATVTLDRGPKYQSGRFRAYNLISDHGGTAAYIINRPTAKWLLQQKDKLRLPVDLELFDPDRRNIPQVDVYQWISPLCIQDELLDGRFTSNIVERFECIEDTSTLRGRVVYYLKSLFRPIYVWFYSLLLLPGGRFRKTLIWQDRP